MPPVDGVSHFDQFAKTYLQRAIKDAGKVSWANDAGMLERIRDHMTATGARLGALGLSAITEDELEAFHAALQTDGLAASTRTQYVQLLKASFRWAARKGYLQKSPIFEDTTIKRSRIAQRRRRVSPAEEKALLDAAAKVTRGAGKRLQWLVIAALETGCRRGELLALIWADVNLDKGVLLIRAVEEG